MNEIIQRITVWILPIIFAITLHEAAHAWAAWKLGDSTARQQGRVTLNPIAHIDPLGTVILPLILMMLPGGFIFGWAKPVPVNWMRLGNPRRDIALVSLAGPGANLAMIFGWALLLKISIQFNFDFFQQVGVAGIMINAVLIALNMLPILPLDGGRVLHSLLPPHLAEGFAQLEPYGFIVLLGLLAFGLLGKILLPIVNLLLELVALIFSF